MTFETERLLVRPFDSGDLQDVHEYCCQEGVGEAAGWKHHGSIFKTAVWLQIWMMEKSRFAVVLKDENKVIGHLTINPDPHDRFTKEIGFVLNRDYQNQGYMSEAVPVLMQQLFSRGIRKLWAQCYTDNPSSRRVLEKCGFTFVRHGTFTSDDMHTTKDTDIFTITNCE